MNRNNRSAIAPLNAVRIPEILQEHPEASTTSTYYKERIPKLKPEDCPNHAATTVSIIRSDSFTAAKSILDKYGASANGKVCVMNMASDKTPGGGYLSGSRAQEECLCYRSTLYPTLDPDHRRTRYPLPPLGAIYTDTVVVFRKEVAANSAEEFTNKNQRFSASVISVAGLRQRHVDLDNNVYKSAESERLLRAKIRQILRACANHRQYYLVLGAIGCGAFRNPPKLVAKHFRSVLEEPEFHGWFADVSFGILDSGREKNGDVFEEVMKDVVVGSGGKSGETTTGDSDGEEDFSSFQTRIFDNSGRRGGGRGRGNRGGGNGGGNHRGGGAGGGGRGGGGSASGFFRGRGNVLGGGGNGQGGTGTGQ